MKKEITCKRMGLECSDNITVFMMKCLLKNLSAWMWFLVKIFTGFCTIKVPKYKITHIKVYIYSCE